MPANLETQQWPQDWKWSVFMPILKRSESEVAQSFPTLCNPWTGACPRILHPWDFPGKNSGVGCHFLLQVIFPTQGIEPGSLALRADTSPAESPGNPKKGNVKECSNYGTIALISHTSKVMLKIIPARLQQYVNCELPDVQAGFRKGRGTRGQIANIHWIIEKARELQKNIYFCFIDYVKAFDCVDHNKLWQILKEMGIPDHLICLLRNRYVDQEAIVRTGYGTTDWFQIGKGVHQGCILSPCLFNLYAEYIIRNAGIKIARRNISNSDMQMTLHLRQKVKN